jgi:hypothetical protein
MALPLDCVYLIEPKKNRISLTINFRPLKSDLMIPETHKIVVFGMIESNDPNSIDSFDGL